MFLSLYSLYWLRWKRRLDTLSVLAYEKTGGMQDEHITREHGP